MKIPSTQNTPTMYSGIVTCEALQSYYKHSFVSSTRWLVISGKPCPGRICAVSALESIYQKYGYQTLDRTLRLLIGTWEGTEKSFSANILNGVARLLFCYDDQLSDDIFKEKLSRISIRELSRTARGRRAGSLGFSEAMLLE